jgi:tetratricopeptide (TPR) repeat protein
MNRKLKLIIVCGVLLCIAAMGLVALVASSNATSVKEYLAEAEKLAKEYKYDDALKIIDKALKIEPKNEQALLLQAGVFIDLNRADDALKANDKLISLFPNNTDYLLGKMFLAAKMRRYDVVLKLWDDPCLLAIMHGEPNSAFVWIKKSEPLMQLNRNDEAIKALEKAVKLDPNKTPEVSGKLQRVKEMAKNNERLKAQQSDPNFKKLTRENRFDEALRTLEKAPVIDANNETAIKKQFRTFMESNQVDDGLKVCDKLVALEPNDPNRWQFKRMVAAETGRWEEALKVSDKLIQLQPDNIDALIGKGQCLVELKQNDEALKALDKATTMDPNSSDAWNIKGAVQGLMKNYDEAIISCNKAVKLSPPWFTGRFVYGRACVYALKGDKTSALADLKRAIELRPDFKAKAKEDVNFKTLQSDPDFKNLTE